MEAILMALSPFVVSGLTWLIKQTGLTGLLSGPWETTVLRFLVAVFSFCTSLSVAMLSHSAVDTTALQVFADAILTFVGATGVYFFASKKPA